MTKLYDIPEDAGFDGAYPPWLDPATGKPRGATLDSPGWHADPHKEVARLVAALQKIAGFQPTGNNRDDLAQCKKIAHDAAYYWPA